MQFRCRSSFWFRSMNIYIYIYIYMCVCENSLLRFLNDKIRHSYLYWVLCIEGEMGKGIHNHISLTFCGSTKRKKKKTPAWLEPCLSNQFAICKKKKKDTIGIWTGFYVHSRCSHLNRVANCGTMWRILGNLHRSYNTPDVAPPQKKVSK